AVCRWGWARGDVGESDGCAEEVRGQAVDARGDCFSLGCALYGTLPGCRAFQRDRARDTRAATLHELLIFPVNSRQGGNNGKVEKLRENLIDNRTSPITI